jgi:hypothetical protein
MIIFAAEAKSSPDNRRTNQISGSNMKLQEAVATRSCATQLQ